MTKSEHSLSTDTALRLLAKKGRRQILHRVAETPDGTTLDELARHQREVDTLQSDGSGTYDDRETELHHVHLPMLQEANVVEYDPAEGTVTRSQEFQTVLSLLEVIEDHREASPQTNS